jgi:hypothetical protein
MERQWQRGIQQYLQRDPIDLQDIRTLPSAQNKSGSISGSVADIGAVRLWRYRGRGC